MMISPEERAAWRERLNAPYSDPCLEAAELRDFAVRVLDALEERDALIRMSLYELAPDDLVIGPKEMLEIATDKKAPWNAVCRVCGCSWFNACPDCCSWVEPDLCSSCAGKKEAT